MWVKLFEQEIEMLEPAELNIIQTKRLQAITQIVFTHTLADSKRGTVEREACPLLETRTQMVM